MRRLSAMAALVVLVSCAAGPRTLTPRMSHPWLVSVGFTGRGEWPSAVLHLDKDGFGGAGGVSYLLGRVPELRLGRAEGEGWGIFRARGADGTGCQLSVWVNGTRMARLRDRSPVTVDALIRIKALDALEVHLGPEGPVLEEPVCGSVMLWSEQNWDPSDLPFVGRVLGRVVGAEADTVTAVTLSPGRQRVSPGPDGRFEFEPVLPGIYQVTFRAGDKALHLRSVRVFALRDSNIEVELGPGAPR